MIASSTIGKKKGKKSDYSPPPCNGYVGHDTHYHGDGISGSNAYQDWHVNFKYNRGGCGSTSPNYISISDDDGNSVQVNNPGNNYRVTTADYGWLEGGDQVTVYFQKFGTSTSVTRTMPDPNSAPSTPSGLSPTGDGLDLRPDVSATYSDPDGDSGTLYFEDGSGNSIGSCNVNDGQSCSVNYGSANQWGQTYSYRVYAEDSGGETSSRRTRSFTTNYGPSAGALQPSGSGQDLTPDISAGFSDPDGDSGTLYFEDGSGNSIGSCNVNDGDRCSVNYGSANQWGESYTFEVYAEDSHGVNSGRTSNTFTTNYGPTVSNLRPTGEEVDRNPVLRADVSDQDGENVQVDFVNPDNGNNLGQDTVDGAGLATLDTSNVDGYGGGVREEYRFRVVADDGQVTDSGTQSFTTNDVPSIEEFNIEPKGDEHSVTVDSSIRDRNGYEDIDRCTLVASGEDGTESYTINNPPREDSDNFARCDFGTIDHTENSDWSHLEDLDFRLTVWDDQGASTTENLNQKLPNNEPRVQDIDIDVYADREAFSVSSLIEFPDNGASEIRSCSVVVEDEESSYSVGTMDRINSSWVRCSEDDIGPSRFETITSGEEIQINIRGTDTHGTTGERSSFYNSETGIDHDTTAIVVQEGGVEFTDFKLAYQGEGQTKFRTELSGVNATFTENNGKVINSTLVSGESRNLNIEIAPGVNLDQKEKTLRITSENLNTGIIREDEIAVRILDTSSPNVEENQVPGISIIQLIFLIGLATIYYIRSDRRLSAELRV